MLFHFFCRKISSWKKCLKTNVNMKEMLQMVLQLPVWWYIFTNFSLKSVWNNFIIINFEESWSRTEQYTVKGRHQWTIDNFLHRAQFTEVGDSLCSPIFGVPVDVVGSPKPQELMFQVWKYYQEKMPRPKLVNWNYRIFVNIFFIFWNSKEI